VTARRRIAVTLPDDLGTPDMRTVFSDREVGSVVWPWAIGLALVTLAVVAFALDHLRFGASTSALGFGLMTVAGVREARLWRRYFGDAAALIGATFEREKDEPS